MKTLGIIFFTDNGEKLSHKITEELTENTRFVFPQKKGTAREFVKNNFDKVDGFIFICATGIAVRMIAPYIKSKDTDPAVIVMDELGNYVISLLSGHLGGANSLCQNLSVITGGQAVITTATDINGSFAVDNWAKANNCAISDISKIKSISSEILRGNTVGFTCDYDVEGDIPTEFTTDIVKAGIVVSVDEEKMPYDETINIIPRVTVLGVGCRRNTNPESFEEFILEILRINRISIKSVKSIASIDLKKNEECILNFSSKYNIPFSCYSAEQLQKVEGDFKPSEFVKKTTGVDNVCERSAAMACDNGDLIIRKTSSNGMTIAVAAEDWKCRF